MLQPCLIFFKQNTHQSKSHHLTSIKRSNSTKLQNPKKSNTEKEPNEAQISINNHHPNNNQPSSIPSTQNGNIQTLSNPKSPFHQSHTHFHNSKQQSQNPLKKKTWLSQKIQTLFNKDKDLKKKNKKKGKANKPNGCSSLNEFLAMAKPALRSQPAKTKHLNITNPLLPTYQKKKTPNRTHSVYTNTRKIRNLTY